MSSSLGEIQTASKLRDIVISMTKSTVEKMRPAERIGKVYSVDYTRSVAKIYFPGDSIDSLIEARFAADKIPTVAMIDTFATAGYEAAGNIVRVAGGPGAYYILDYVSGIPAIDPSARALLLTNTVQINANVTAVSNSVSALDADLTALQADLDAAEADLLVLNTTTIPQLQTDIGTANADIDALENVTIPALNTRLTTAENDINTLETVTIPGLNTDIANANTAISNRVRVMFQTTQPTGLLSTDRVIWYDTDAGNTASYWNGTSWAPYTYGSAAITDSAITTAKLVDNAITNVKIADNAVGSFEIIDNAIVETKILAGAVTTLKMTANSIDGDRIAANTLNANKIIAGSITTDRMTANTINGDRILANTLHADKIISNTITANKLSVVMGGGNLVNNSSFEDPLDVPAPSGGATAESSTTQAYRGLRSLKLASTVTGGDTFAFIGPITGLLPSTTYVVSLWYYVESITGASLGNRWIWVLGPNNNSPFFITDNGLTTGVATGVWTRKVYTFTTAASGNGSVSCGLRLYTGNGAIYYDAIQVEPGDVVTSYAPKADEILPGTISAAMIQTDAVIASKIQAGAINTTHMTANTINGDRITANTLNADRIVAGSITTDRMTANTINGDRILVNTLGASKIVAGSITTDRMTANTIDGSVILANSLNASKIVAGSITTDRMTANTINGDRISARTIDGGKIVAGSVTTDLMTANSINGDRITVNTLNADRIVANSITSSQIAANGIKAANISVGDFTNYVPPILEWADTSDTNIFEDTQGPVCVLIGNGTSNTHVYMSSPASATDIPVKTGDQFRFEWAVYANYSGRTGNVVPFFQWLSADKATVVSTVSGTATPQGTNSYAVVTHDLTVPADVYWLRFAPYAQANAQGAIRRVSLRRKNGGDLIVDGAIDGKTITGATITGGLFKTAASGKRIEMTSTNSDVIQWINSSGANTASISLSGANPFTIASGIGMAINAATSMTLQATSINLTGLVGSFDFNQARLVCRPYAWPTYAGTELWSAESGGNFYFSIYNPHINRMIFLNGTGIYSTEGSATIGCEFYGQFISWSDMREKSNFQAVDSALDMVRKLPVYDYNTPHGGAGKDAKSNKLVRKRGIMAQDLQKVAPHLVHDETDDPNTGFGMGVDLYGLLATTLAGLQALDSEVETLKKQLKENEK